VLALTGLATTAAATPTLLRWTRAALRCLLVRLRCVAHVADCSGAAARGREGRKGRGGGERERGRKGQGIGRGGVTAGEGDHRSDMGCAVGVACRMTQGASLPPFLEETMCLICPCLFAKRDHPIFRACEVPVPPSSTCMESVRSIVKKDPTAVEGEGIHQASSGGAGLACVQQQVTSGANARARRRGCAA
jgi:hypothetical protein